MNTEKFYLMRRWLIASQTVYQFLSTDFVLSHQVESLEDVFQSLAHLWRVHFQESLLQEGFSDLAPFFGELKVGRIGLEINGTALLDGLSDRRVAQRIGLLDVVTGEFDIQDTPICSSWRNDLCTQLGRGSQRNRVPDVLQITLGVLFDLFRAIRVVIVERGGSPKGLDKVKVPSGTGGDGCIASTVFLTSFELALSCLLRY